MPDEKPAPIYTRGPDDDGFPTIAVYGRPTIKISLLEANCPTTQDTDAVVRHVTKLLNMAAGT